VLVVSADVFNERTGTVIAVALTSREPRAGFPLSLEIRAAGLPRRSWALMGQIRTFSAERLGRRLARAAEEDLARVVDGLNEIIG
jgi:mRNA interferase MazF